MTRTSTFLHAARRPGQPGDPLPGIRRLLDSDAVDLPQEHPVTLLGMPVVPTDQREGAPYGPDTDVGDLRAPWRRIRQRQGSQESVPLRDVGHLAAVKPFCARLPPRTCRDPGTGCEYVGAPFSRRAPHPVEILQWFPQLLHGPVTGAGIPVFP
ncbi:hypothetical protein Ate01nite_49440 [Actinoplanes teichomyceticus]|nr:hypothetical protein Ate01nite_49440 [Actinoplanes teichomyceticus]